MLSRIRGIEISTNVVKALYATPKFDARGRDEAEDKAENYYIHVRHLYYTTFSSFLVRSFIASRKKLIYSENSQYLKIFKRFAWLAKY